MAKRSQTSATEMNVTFNALRLAYLYTVTFLFLWVIVDYTMNQNFSSIALFLLVTQNFILLLSKLYFEKKNTNNDENH